MTAREDYPTRTQRTWEAMCDEIDRLRCLLAFEADECSKWEIAARTAWNEAACVPDEVNEQGTT